MPARMWGVLGSGWLLTKRDAALSYGRPVIQTYFERKTLMKLARIACIYIADPFVFETVYSLLG
jgi:hypothetical protein